MSPSLSMVSTNSSGPIFTPLRRWAACGAQLMLSMPPAATMLLSPVRICCAASATERRPEPHSWLTLKAVFSSGMPAPRAAWRAGPMPSPAARIWPRISSSTSAGETPARWKAPCTATMASSCAGSELSVPLKLPTGVRAADAITMSSMIFSLLGCAFKPCCAGRQLKIVSQVMPDEAPRHGRLPRGRLPGYSPKRRACHSCAICMRSSE